MILTDWTLYYFDICKLVNTTGDIGTVQFIFFLALRLHIMIVASVTSFIMILAKFGTAKMVPFSYSHGRSAFFTYRLHDFYVTICRCL